MKFDHGHSHGGPGGRPTATYRTWINMKARCDNYLASNYEYYGGRGISYDPRWRDFNNFLEDMGEKPDKLTLERIDNNKNYSKDNCRWATQAEQSQNKNTYRTNKSGQRGVSWDRKKKKWRAYYACNGRNVFLYTGESFEEACSARIAWEQANGR